MMAPHQIYRAKLDVVDDIADLEVGHYVRVLSIDRRSGEFVFDAAQVSYRKLSLLDFVFGREPEQYIRVRP